MSKRTAWVLTASIGLAWAGPGAAQQPVKYARFRVGDKIAYGIVEGEQVRELSGRFGAWEKTDTTHALSAVKLLAPAAPRTILACAGNYKSHLGDKSTHPHAEFFFKPPSCITGPEANIVIPPGATDVHYEGELVIVIGKRAKNVPAEKALDYVLGVTCGNDVSERIWQKKDVQWWRAKGSDTFGPIGPFIVGGIKYDDLLLQTRVNGQVVQDQRTSDLVSGVAQTVSWASRHLALQPGDLIFTGTPGTTSALKPGDVVEVEIEAIGVLRNRVVARK